MTTHDRLCSPDSLYGDDAEDEFCHCELAALIRADEQDKDWRRNWRYGAVRAEVLADLKAMPIQVVNMQPIPGKPDDFREAVLLADVLALFGEEVSDE